MDSVFFQAVSEKHTALFTIWTHYIDSISYNDNRYAKCVSVVTQLLWRRRTLLHLKKINLCCIQLMVERLSEYIYSVFCCFSLLFFLFSFFFFCQISSWLVWEIESAFLNCRKLDPAVRLQFLSGVRSTSSLPLLPSSLWYGVEVPVWFPSLGRINLSKNY